MDSLLRYFILILPSIMRNHGHKLTLLTFQAVQHFYIVKRNVSIGETGYGNDALHALQLCDPGSNPVWASMRIEFSVPI